MSEQVRAFAPGRVNVIGDHTDYTGGFVLPCAIDRGTTVTLERSSQPVLSLRSLSEPAPAEVKLPVGDPAAVTPRWARYVAGVAAEVGATTGGVGFVETTLPVAAGLSSSAALEVALALALGHTGSPTELAQLCQRAEQRAVGVPCGVMDQLASVSGVEGHCLLIDCATLAVTPVALPDDVGIVVVDSREPRTLVTSAYAERRAACERAAAQIGPLRDATLDDLDGVTDPVARRRARHVLTENRRVLDTVAAFNARDAAGAGAAMRASHASLRDDFAVSTEGLDRLVAALDAHPAVHGARLTGAGFGGCAVALVDAGSADAVAEAFDGWVVRASAGARLTPAG